MSDVKQSLQDKLTQLEKGLFLMSLDQNLIQTSYNFEWR